MNTRMKTLMSQRIFNSNSCRMLFATCLSALCLVALSTQAATITVMNTNNNAAGSLRQALADAVDGDTINFDSSFNGQTITLTSGELVVDKSVTINGPGSDNLTVDGNHASRVFHVSGGVTVTIAGLTVTNGSVFSTSGGGIYNDHSTLTMSNCTLSDNSASDNGGAIYNDHAALTLNNCAVSGNSAPNAGGGVCSDGESGSATLTVNNSSFSGNSTVSLGGGILNDGSFGGSATLIVNNSSFSGNSALYLGGGILNFGELGGSATLMLDNSTFSGNSAANGGGIYNDGLSGSAPLTLDNSTFSGNSAADAGGSIYNYGLSGSAPLTLNNSTFSSNSAMYGGAIGNVAAVLTLSNCTVSGNSAYYFGGGIDNNAFLTSATLTLNSSTFSGNSASSGGAIYNNSNGGSATLALTDTILNAGVSGENIFSDGTVTSHGYNLSSDNGGGLLTATGDQINTDPLLGLLQDNGGPTFTHALLVGSPAIDAGDPNFTPPPDYDQRGPGYDRVVNGRIDIGAFEAQTVTPSYAGQVQPPINADGTSTFSVRRGVVPVKFTLTQGGVATCDLPPATIAVTRTAGGVIGEVNESVYSGNADTGSNFRVDSCQYVYNLNSRALGVGTYRVDILIDGQVVGSATFELK
jgi:predicted outer membrane repeat protein